MSITKQPALELLLVWEGILDVKPYSKLIERENQE